MTADIGAEEIRLAVSNADGSRLRLLPHIGREEQPAWSPDGQRIAFLRRDQAGYADVYVRPFGGDVARQLTATQGIEEGRPTWSPDGRRLAFESGGTIVVMPSEGGEARPLVDGRSPAWSADDRIAYSEWSTVPGIVRLMIIPATGGAPSFATTFDTVFGTLPLETPAWSSDGRIAVVERKPFVRPFNLDWALVVIRPGTAERTAVLVDTFPILQPTWSPDGRRIAFVRRRFEELAVWTIGADGSAPRRVTGSAFSHPSWR